ncbi:MAG: hypothetical protein N3A72_05360 [bacterium]|nr:hypothetical protein [bacterium]
MKRKRIIPMESTIYIEPDGKINIINYSKEMVDLTTALNPNRNKRITRFHPNRKKKRK